jgi:conjugative transfer signal peptidase TraF
MFKNKFKNKNNYRVFVYVALCFFIFFFIWVSGIRFNYTSSMPIGFYLIKSNSSLNIERYVVVKLPDDILLYGYKRGYLLTDNTKVIKQIIAKPGDNVILTNEEIIVNGVAFYAPTHKYDSLNRSLHIYPRGKYFNTDRYWLYGSGNKKESWDSRYYGPIEKSHIIGLAIPFLIF